MNADLENEVQLIISQLSSSQKKALKQIFGDEPEKAPKLKGYKVIPAKERIFNCSIELHCKLCGYKHRQVFKSSSPLPTIMETPSCSHCYEVLNQLTKEELIRKLIRLGDESQAKLDDHKVSITRRPIERRSDDDEESTVCTNELSNDSGVLPNPEEPGKECSQPPSGDSGEPDTEPTQQEHLPGEGTA